MLIVDSISIGTMVEPVLLSPPEIASVWDGRSDALEVEVVGEGEAKCCVVVVVLVVLVVLVVMVVVAVVTGNGSVVDNVVVVGVRNVPPVLEAGALVDVDA